MGIGGCGMPTMDEEYGAVPIGLLLVFADVGDTSGARGGVIAANAAGVSVVATAAGAEEVGCTIQRPW